MYGERIFLTFYINIELYLWIPCRAKSNYLWDGLNTFDRFIIITIILMSQCCDNVLSDLSVDVLLPDLSRVRVFHYKIYFFCLFISTDL